MIVLIDLAGLFEATVIALGIFTVTLILEKHLEYVEKNKKR